MARSVDRGYESAYDAESNLRVVRFAGEIEMSWLIATAPYDPTHAHLPYCLTLIDQRAATFRGGPSDVSELAGGMVRQLGPRHSERHAWVVANMESVGIAMHYQTSAGGSRVRWFTKLEEACRHLGVTIDDYTRAEAMLEPVVAGA